MKNKYTMADFRKGLMLAGLVPPENEQEKKEKQTLDEYEKIKKVLGQYFIYQDTQGNNIRSMSPPLRWGKAVIFIYGRPECARTKDCVCIFRVQLKQTT